MPEEETLRRAEHDREEGKSASTQAGEFVREEMHHVREGKHGARNTRQAIAIGLSKARRAGVDLQPPKEGTTSEATREHAKRDTARGRRRRRSKPSARRSRKTTAALKREPRKAASHTALSRQARQASKKRSASSRSASARKGARTRARGRR